MHIADLFFYVFVLYHIFARTLQRHLSKKVIPCKAGVRMLVPSPYQSMRHDTSPMIFSAMRLRNGFPRSPAARSAIRVSAEDEKGLRGHLLTKYIMQYFLYLSSTFSGNGERQDNP